MADKSKASGPLDQHPLVAELRPDPSASSVAATELVGFPGNSNRAGYQRLYLTSTLDSYAEFAVDDILYATTVPRGTSPFPGHEVVIVTIPRDVTVDYTWTRQGGDAQDDFDLDVRFEAQAQPSLSRLGTSLINGNPSCFPGGCGPGGPTRNCTR
jgi:hypothetical protein